MIQSLDPRIRRLAEEPGTGDISGKEGYGENYEVFHQDKRGAQHRHVGSVLAANPQMALVFAKEQFGRRKKCVNLWVVRSRDILALPEQDEDMFATNSDKTYRDASGFRVMDKIRLLKSNQTGGEEP